MAGFEITRKGKQHTLGAKGICAAAVFCVLTAVFAAHFSVFESAGKILSVMAMELCAILLVMLLLWKEKYRKRRILVFLILAGGLLFAGRNSIFSGMVAHANSYIQLRNEFYGINQPLIEETATSYRNLLFLFVVEFVFALILYSVLMAGRCTFIAICVMLIPVILAATVGKMPSEISSWGLLAAAFFYLIVQHKKETGFPGRECVRAAGILGILYICTLIVQPVIADYKENNKEEYKIIKEALIDAQYIDVEQLISEKISGEEDYSRGGIGKGNLSNIAKHQPVGTQEMEVILTEKPDSTVYLKAFVGTTYTGNRWEEMKGSEFSKIISPILGGQKKQELMSEPFTRIKEGSSETEQEQMQIQLQEASAKYAYTPYFAEILKSDSVYLDAYVKGQGKKERQYAYYPMAEAMDLDDDQLAEASELWLEYQDFVEEEYVEYPKGLEQLAALCDSMQKRSADEVGDEIDQLFKKSFSYSYTPGKMPSDMDFVEGFLFEKKNGFCVHFASAATLIYRNCGYPARYVEGYAIDAEQFEKQEDGTYKAQVSDEMAHAWCETFDSDKGWILREHTLSYSEGYDTTQDREEYNDYNEPEQNVEIPENEPANEPIEEIPEDIENDAKQNVNEPDQTDLAEKDANEGTNENTEDSSVNKQEKRIEKAIIFIIVFVSLALFGVVSMEVQYRIRRRRRFGSFRKRKDNQGIANIYDVVCELCIYAGMEKKQMREKDRLEEMIQGFPQLTEEEWRWMYDCAQRAAFAGRIISKEEHKQMLWMYKKLRKKMISGFDRKKRFWMKYGKAI